MSRIVSTVLGLTAVLTALAGTAEARQWDRGASITLYERPGFQGRSVTLNGNVDDLSDRGFNDKARSFRISGGQWRLCQDANFRSRCETFTRDEIDLQRIDFSGVISSAQLQGGGGDWGRDRDRDWDRDRDRGDWAGGYGHGGNWGRSRVVLFEGPYFQGRSVTIDSDVDNLSDLRFNDRARSVRVFGYGQWRMCQDSDYRGRCETFNRDVENLDRFSFGGVISSVQRAGGGGGNPYPGGGNPYPGGGRGARIIFYEGPYFQGRSVILDSAVSDFSALGFNDRPRSVRVISGQWRACQDADFRSRCEIFNRDMEDLGRINFSGVISSAQPY